MEIDIILQYYSCPDKCRQEEIDACLKHNLENELISWVHLLIEESFNLKAFNHCDPITQTVIFWGPQAEISSIGQTNDSGLRMNWLKSCTEE